MPQNPKFKPQETPLTNYNNGVIAWSFFKLVYENPLGPKVGQYDPYYIYSVQVQMGDQWVPHTWFATIEDHIRIQIAGGTKDTIMKGTYVRDQNKRALVVFYASGPSAPRQEAQVRQQVDAAVQELLNQQSGSSFDDDNLFNAPGGHQEAQGVGASADTPPDPFSSVVPPTPPTPTPTPPAPAPSSPTVTQPPAQPYTPPSNSRNYMPLNDGEKAAWQARFKDIAELQVWAYGAIMELAKEQGVKIKPSDQREVMTSIAIQTWREFSAKGGLYGWSYVAPLSAETKNGALEKMGAYTQEQFANRSEFIKSWLGDVAEPMDSIGSWKHAANIAKLFGVESNIIYDDFEIDTMMMIAAAIWSYQESRDEGMTRNESLQYVAEEYGLPIEAMSITDEDEDE